jgi:hypothetical protein
MSAFTCYKIFLQFSVSSVESVYGGLGNPGRLHPVGRVEHPGQTEVCYWPGKTKKWAPGIFLTYPLFHPRPVVLAVQVKEQTAFKRRRYGSW